MCDTRPVTIFLVEDNPADVRLLEIALNESNTTYKLIHARDGEEAILMLQRFGEDLPWPDIMLLDLNLPKRSGLEVLQERHASRTLTRIPALVLTCSRREFDVDSAYDWGANAFMQKPKNVEGMIDLARLLRSYWLDLVVRPCMPGPCLQS